MSKAVAKKSKIIPVSVYDSSDTWDILEEHAGAGFEDTNADDFVLPFIKKAEHQSKCLQKQHEKYVPGAEAGQLVHNVMLKSFDTLYMLPVKYDNFLQHYKAPIFSHLYEISLKPITNDKGSFYAFAYDTGTVVSDRAMLTDAVDLMKSLREVDTTTLAPEVEGSDNTEPSNDSFEI